MKTEMHWLLWTALVVIGTFVVFTLTLWWIGLFDFTGTEASSKVVAASIALVGGLVASLISGAAVVLKHGMDIRNTNLQRQAEERLRVEAEHNANLREEAEKRLKLDTAIRAIELLSNESGADVPITQRAGVLFALSSLGMIELSLRLLRQMLMQENIDAATASSIVNDGLHMQREFQIPAAMLLDDFPRGFIDSGGVPHLPRMIVGTWNSEISSTPQYSLALGVIKIIISKPKSEWEEGYLITLVITLSGAWMAASGAKRQGIGACLLPVLRALEPGEVYEYEDVVLDIDAICNKLEEEAEEETLAPGDELHQLSKRTAEWARES